MKTTRSNIIAKIGQDRYAQACAFARQAARSPHYGTGNAVSDFDSRIAHDIANLICNSQLPVARKMRLLLRFYDDMPCYAYLMYLASSFHELGKKERTFFWQWARDTLAAEDQSLVAPVAYSLWCDFFENPQTVNEAWKALTDPLPTPAALRQILIHSGPVPYAAKQALYMQLLDDEQWHYYIYRSLLHSAFDIYGDIDAHAANKILNRLHLGPDTEHFNKLRRRLAQRVQEIANSTKKDKNKKKR